MSVGIDQIDFRVTLAKSPAVRVVKRDVERDAFIERHERSMLALLVEKYPREAAEIVRKKYLDKR